jgi:hypothetical protein
MSLPGRHTPKKTLLTKALLTLFMLLACSEIGIRVSGVTDFPTYQVADGIEYIPTPNQHGAFLHKNAWVFNDRSMGTEKPWNPAARPNILLIGNSIVMGGNPYDQKDKLGALLQNAVGSSYAVWPIAAGGWTNVNETMYLHHNPDVARTADYFLWEYMSGGLSGPTPWQGEYVFPKARPAWAGWYVLRRYVMPRVFGANINELPQTGPLSAAELGNFRAAVATLERAKHHGLLFLYPKKAEYLLALQGKEWLPERPEIERIAREYDLRIIDISQAKEWNAALYRDDGVHPLAQGNAVLAGILGKALNEAIAEGIPPSTTAQQ